MTLATINKDKFFRGGANIAPDPDAGKELGELIYDIQVAVNLVENGIVDGDFAGTALGRLTRTGVGAYAVIQDNLAAAVAPTVGDDNTAGYGIGSLWLDTTAYRLYICTDASTGAAIWIGQLAKNNVAATAPAVGDDDADGYSVGSMWTDTVTAIIWVCQSAATGAAVWNPIVKSNFAGAADPAVGDDDADGYAVGSIWVNTTAVPPRAFRCVSPATGAAVWRQLSAQSNLAAAVAPVVGDDDTAGYDVGSLWFDTTAHRLYTCTDASTGAAVWVGPVVKNGSGAVPPGVGDDDADGYSIGSLWFDTVTGISWFCQSAATGAAVWNPTVKCNFSAAVGPAVGDDTTLGYAVGSIWIDTTAVPPTVFRCVDPATGAAVWRQLNAQSNVAAAAAPAVGNDDTEGYDVGSVWLDTTADIAYICLDNATGAAVWRVLAARQIVENYQGAAATATLRVFRALVAGHITHVAAETGTVAAAAEDMTLDVQIGGVTCLTGLITIDDTVVIDTPEAGVVDVAANDFAVGDLISVVRTYTAGGAPTPMRDTAIGIEIQAD